LSVVAWNIRDWFTKTPEQIIEELTANKTLDAEGNLNIEKVKENFPAMPKENQELILKTLAKAMLDADINFLLEGVADDKKQDAQQMGRNAQVDVEGNMATVRFDDLAGLPDQERIKESYQYLGVSVKFQYRDDVLKGYVSQMKTTGKSGECIATLRAL